MRYMKGQFSLTNIIGLFLGLIVLLLVAFPILNPLIASTVAALPVNAYTPITAALLFLVPTAMIVGVIVTIFRYASGSPPQQGYYGR